MAERVYIETTVVSYLTARPNRDVVIAGHQQVTHDWWDTRRQSYELCVSQLVRCDIPRHQGPREKERHEVRILSRAQNRAESGAAADRGRRFGFSGCKVAAD